MKKKDSIRMNVSLTSDFKESLTRLRLQVECFSEVDGQTEGGSVSSERLSLGGTAVDLCHLPPSTPPEV